jgi:hypothetical protein
MSKYAYTHFTYKLVSLNNTPTTTIFPLLLTTFFIVYSIITDFICALLPVLVVWNLQIARSLKLAVGGLMSLGLVATACAIVRATSLNIQVTDMSYDYCIASIWASTELHLGIIATNLSLSRSISRYYIKSSFFSSFNTQDTKIDLSSRGYGSSGLSRLTSRDNEVQNEP